MEKFISLGAVLVFGLRLVIKGASIGDAGALAALCALYGFSLYLETKKQQPINDSFKAEVRLELEQIKTSMNGLKISKAFGRI